MPDGITKMISMSRRGAWAGVLTAIAWTSSIRREPRTTRFRGDAQRARRAARAVGSARQGTALTAQRRLLRNVFAREPLDERRQHRRFGIGYR
jgi:hypothetical protein